MGLTADEEHVANNLHDKGYAVIDFPDAELDARIERIKTHLSPRYGINFEDPQSDKTNGERRIQDAWQFDEDVRAVAANRTMLDLLGKFYGRPAFPFQTLNFPVGTQQDGHSDCVHFSSLPERFMCGVWVALEDVRADAGPLFYYPGSHRWPIMTNALVGRRGYGSDLSSAQDPYGPAWKALCEAYDAQAETFLARKGQALIWCANLLHGGSRQNDLTLTRWSQVTHYYFDDCIYYTPAFSDEALGELHLRNPMAIQDGLSRPCRHRGEIVPKTPRPQAIQPSRFSKLIKYLIK
nr:phytanoyl-CoA dioxygenase family protein [Sphingobium subterraneum]